MVRILVMLPAAAIACSLCFLLPAVGEESLPVVSRTHQSEAEVQSPVPTKLDRILVATFPERRPLHAQEQGPRRDSARTTRTAGRVPLMEASATNNLPPLEQRVHENPLPGSLGRVLLTGTRDDAMDPIVGMESPQATPRAFRSPSLVDRNNVQALIMPGDHLSSVGNIPTSLEDRFRRLEIEVSHSGHHLKLIGESFSGTRQVLHECRVGLGSSEFPTPVGVYFVTHVYDQDPWWIPPPNRAWAAGQSPSRKVYGGVMAPLLKKRSVRTRGNLSEGSEDKIEGQVRLEDYGYRFHGTNAPRSIGRNQSHGCVRMLPKDVKQIAELIKDHVGTLDRLESVNGSFVLLKSPIRLNLVK